MPRSAEIDALMVDYLYGELSASEAEEFRKRLDADPDLRAEVAALERTRRAFGALEQEEPPPAVTARLMHAAAQRAPAAPAREPGLWARIAAWFEPVARHPAVASVAALVVVGGVAGALYLRGYDRMARPVVATEARAPDAVRAAPAPPAAAEASDGPARPAQLAEAKEEEALDEARGRAAAGDDLAGAVRDEDGVVGLGGVAADVPAGRRQAGASKVAGGDRRAKRRAPAAGERAAPPAAAPQERATKAARKPQRQRSPSPEAPLAGVLEAREGAEAAPAPPPARKAPAPPAAASPRARADDDFAGPPADEADAPTATVAGGADRNSAPDGRYRVYKDARADRWAKAQHGRLNRALAAKASREARCREAARIANDILDRNPEYYVAHVAKSPRLTPCRSFVASERNRRLAARKARRSAGDVKAASDEAAAEPPAKQAPSGD